jgi:hypothetical protein
MRDKVKIALNTIARRAFFVNFLPLFSSRFLLAGLSRKLTEKFLRELCGSSEAGGKSMPK